MTTARTPKLYVMGLVFTNVRLVAQEVQPFYGTGDGPNATNGDGGVLPIRHTHIDGNGYGQGWGWGANSRKGQGKSQSYPN